MKQLPETILFDLDGTLLGMDEEKFTKLYLGLLAKEFETKLNPQKLVKAVWDGVGAMVVNDGSKKNADVFWDVLNKEFGQDLKPMWPEFEQFYEHKFDEAESSCCKNVDAVNLINKLKDSHRLILATNPIFPEIAVKKRLGWAGIDPNVFEYITTYENSSFCKPDPRYYEEILKKRNLSADECIMIGNDANEDMAAMEAGIPTILVTDCLINRKNKDLNQYTVMTMHELAETAQ